MADNVAITAGSGTNISTDDDGTAHHQRVKLTLGKDGTFTGTLGGEARGSDFAAYVDPRLSAATQTQNSGSLTTSTTAYTAGDTLGAGWTFTSMARASGGTGAIIGVTLLDVADVSTHIDLWIAAASITFGTDNAAPSVSDGDAVNLLHKITMSDYDDLGGCRMFTRSSINVPYYCSGGTSLYVYATTQADHTYFAAATDLKLRLFYLLD